MTNFNGESYIKNVRPLLSHLPQPSWLNYLRKDIEKSLESSKFNLPVKEKLGRCKNLIEELKSELRHRKSYRDFYNLVIKDYKSFSIRGKLLDSEKEKLLGDDKIKLTYSDLRHQSAISWLVLNTRIYEKCVGLCHQLHLIKQPGSQHDQYYAHEVLARKTKDKEKYKFNKYTDKKYKDLLENLNKKFGYYMQIILEFRNQFVHRGEFVDTEGGSVFLSDTEGDKLKLKFLNTVYEKIKKKYIIFQLGSYFPKKDFYKMMENCIKHSDHHVGCLMYLISRTVLSKNGKI